MEVSRGQCGGNEGARWKYEGGSVGAMRGKVEVRRGQCGGNEGARWKYQGGSVGTMRGQGGSMKGAVWGKVEV